MFEIRSIHSHSSRGTCPNFLKIDSKQSDLQLSQVYQLPRLADFSKFISVFELSNEWKTISDVGEPVSTEIDKIWLQATQYLGDSDKLILEI